MSKKTKLMIGLCIALEVILVIGMAGLFIQNRGLSDSLKQYLASNGEIHEIYDDAKVVEAYKSGSAEGLGEQDKYVLEQAKKVIDENITDEMTDYEKEKAIYDWLIAYTDYNSAGLAVISAGDEYSHLPYGVFKYHQAICVGNATTFKLFMDMLGIENELIHSTEEGEHAWNMVKLDGDWYHCDATFDGGTGENPGYAFFNVPDSVKDDGSYPWNHEVFPSADGVKYCYLANNAKELKDVYAVPKYVFEELEKGSRRIAFTLKNDKGYNQYTADYIAAAFNDGMMEVCVEGIQQIGDKNIYIMSVYDMSEPAINGDAESQKIAEKLQEIIDDLQ